MPSNDLAAAIRATSANIGANPLDLATVMSYETGGTLNPWQAGPTTQWGQHRGLIQMGEPQRAKYGVTQNTSVADQVAAAGRYLQDAGFKPGMGRLDLYSAINAGRVGRYNASDANNGGAPGTVADKVNNQMAGHQAKAAALLGETLGSMPAAPAPSAPPAAGQVPQTGSTLAAALPGVTLPSAPAAVSPPPLFAQAPEQAMIEQQGQQAAATREQQRKTALFSGSGRGKIAALFA